MNGTDQGWLPPLLIDWDHSPTTQRRATIDLQLQGPIQTKCLSCWGEQSRVVSSATSYWKPRQIPACGCALATSQSKGSKPAEYLRKVKEEAWLGGSVLEARGTGTENIRRGGGRRSAPTGIAWRATYRGHRPLAWSSSEGWSAGQVTLPRELK